MSPERKWGNRLEGWAWKQQASAFSRVFGEVGSSVWLCFGKETELH